MPALMLNFVEQVRHRAAGLSGRRGAVNDWGGSRRYPETQRKGGTAGGRFRPPTRIPFNKLDSGDAGVKRRDMTDSSSALTPKPWISGIADRKSTRLNSSH